MNTHPSSQLIYVVFGLSLILLTACFETRTVEPPSSGSSDWISPTDYEILLNNLQTAISQRDVQNYLRCFNQDLLRFTPAASLLTDNQSIWQNWSIQDEQAYLENVVNKLTVNSGNSLFLEQLDLQDVSADSLRYVGNYTMRINHNDTTLTDLFKGQIQLVVKINSFSEWEIHTWEDVETVADSSWSLLKLKFVQ